MPGERWYVDTSALTKLVKPETETRALKLWLVGRNWLISDLQRTELRRAARRSSPRALERADRMLAEADCIRLTPDLFDAAGRMDPASLRSLDAMHVAAASQLGGDLAGIVCYDARLAAAMVDAGIEVAAPGVRRS